MTSKTIDIANVTSIPTPRELTPEEEAALIAEYRATRTAEALESDYADFDKQVADGVPAEQLLKDMRDE
jgi:hypothetical protein